MKITYNTRNINMLLEQAGLALADTAESIKTDLIQSQTMPFGKTRYNKKGEVVYQGGTMQNDSTSVDDKKIIKGVARIVVDTPYARKVYFDPEIHIQQEKNKNAKQYYFDDYISGIKKDLPIKWYKQHLQRRIGQ